MSQTLPLLIELGCEELPVKALPGLAAALADGVHAGLAAQGIEVPRDALRALYTPRRLAVLADTVPALQPTRQTELLGPYLNIGLDADGQPTRALLGFAQKAGVDWTALARSSDAKGERFVLRQENPGRATAELLPEVLAAAVKGLPIPKPMRWGDHEHAFIRPVHWLVVLLGGEVVDMELLGVRSGRTTYGHRFHHPTAICLASPREYESALLSARVVVDPNTREDKIRSAVFEVSRELGGRPRINLTTLREVGCLVEWPVPIVCRFESEFLRVPQEVLVLTMETNQKFFPIFADQRKLSEHFVGIANIESADPAQVRQGYERVIRPRFADAAFFFDEDRKQGLSAMNGELSTVTYQTKLGSVADKAGRVAELAAEIAPAAGVDSRLARRAALLSKADLRSRLVGEFPELQGIAGRYLAVEDAALADLTESDRQALAVALDEVYMPRNAGDGIAGSPLGRVLAVAERLDTLVGGFHAGLEPTGNKDPFALRRNALGLARSLIEGRLDLDLQKTFERAIEILDDSVWEMAQRGSTPLGRSRVSPTPRALNLTSFLVERLRGYYEQRDGYDTLVFDAVAALPTGSLVDFDQRYRALLPFVGDEAFVALAAANKRCGNLLRKAQESGEAVPDAVDPARFEVDAERDLAAALAAAEDDTTPLFQARRYEAALTRLAALRPAVDAFFDQVMVMAEDPAVRGNRLALLARLHGLFGRIADIGRLAG
ncbi:MAG: glycine--tRNA ligase subunit beta [Xanthomonadales bacterium]|nr:glycine--tRNA ligase subunit beta [Xanthomonadales bacterium]